MKGLAAGGFAVACLAVLNGCGSDNSQSTIYILPSPSGSASASATATPAPETSSTSLPGSGPAPTPIPSGRIIIDSPDASSTVSSPVEVQGTASVANGTVVVVVQDSAGVELGRAMTTASAAAPDFGHFDVTVSYIATPGTRGKIKAYGVGRDGTTPTWFYFIVVRFS